MTPEERLRAAGIVLPPPLAAVSDFAQAQAYGEFVFVSGHGPLDEERRVVVSGAIGIDVDEEAARTGAELAMSNCLSTLRECLGSLDEVRQVLKVQMYMLTAPGFTRHPWIGDSASQLIERVFGPSIGSHARTTMGVASNPLDVTVSIDLVCARRI